MEIRKRIVIKHTCGRDHVWYANGNTEFHNKAGYGNGYYLWFVFVCNITNKCPAKMIISQDSLLEAIGEVE